MATATTTNEEDDKGQRSTDDKGIATAGEDSKDEKEGTNVFGEVVCEVHSTELV